MINILPGSKKLYLYFDGSNFGLTNLSFFIACMAFSTDGVTCPCTATNTTGCSSLKKCGNANLKYKELCNADGWGFTNCANDKYGILKCLTKGKKINFYPKFSVVRIKLWLLDW